MTSTAKTTNSVQPESIHGSTAKAARPRPAKSLGRARNLLIELGTEELPPKALRNLSQSFADLIFASLVEAGVVENKPENKKAYSTPRRLAVWIKGVLPKQPDSLEARKGPAVSAAFDENGMPTPAALGFAKSCGVNVSKLKRQKSDQGEWLAFEKKARGKKLEQILDAGLINAIKMLPIPKRMRWGDGEEEFVRPVHWLLALYGSDVLKIEALGLKADRLTRGHRFHSPGALKIPSADRYLGTLKSSGYVIADYQARQAVILKQVNRLAVRANGIAMIEDDLLDEVTGLVEWPVSLLGEFDSQFLKLPKEVLVSTMGHHQKYFHLVNKKNKPMPLFITVSNIKSKTPRRVRLGNERVLRARLSDADFFWNTDQKKLLIDREDELKGVLFHNKLGSVLDKSRRIEKLATGLSKSIGADQDDVRLASRLCKADLVTDMVGEFPELQGTIGKYYAINQGISKSVADALESHYLPRHSGDDLPDSAVGQCVALADRIDTLTGIFLCNEKPTGDKDPFGLRRAALGILRILVEGKLDLDLLRLIREGLAIHIGEMNMDSVNLGALENELHTFLMERFKGYLNSEGFGQDAVSAVLACEPAKPLDFYLRLKSVKKFFKNQHSSAISLASANKRIANILSKNFDGKGSNAEFQPGLLRDSAEKELVKNLRKVEKSAGTAFKQYDYDRGFKFLSELKQPIDRFFEEVMVMDDEIQIRNNRLALLDRIRSLFLSAADISKMRVEL